jgi:putative heme-binding domain-containing protein
MPSKLVASASCTVLAAILLGAAPENPRLGATEKTPAPVFQVPPGFVVEKVAGPPLVQFPLFAAFDDRGRLYVAEGTGTNLPGEELVKRKLGRIILLEDTDGDGKFDTSKVFADQLVFPQGVLWHDGAVYTASHPSVWRLEDTTGKGVADRRVELVTGFKFTGNGCDIHGPFLGPDGRLYWTDGRHGYKVKTREGQLLEGLASRIWRCRPDGTDIERVCGGGFDNPVQLTFTSEGEAIGTMDQGPGDALLHYIEGGVYPMEHPCLKEFFMTGPLLGSIRQYSAELPAALCGLTAYRSTAFGSDYQNALFSTQYMLHRIVRHRLVRTGSTFRCDDQDFLTTTNHDVRLTDVIEDADGSLLFIDMGGWFTYHFPGSPLAKPEALPGIYRIRNTRAKPVADPWGKELKLASRAAPDLVAHLGDPRPRVCDQVIHRLGKLGDEGVPSLKAVVRSEGKQSVAARRNAVWALCRIRSDAARAVLRLALADPEFSVRMAAAHAIGLERDAEATSALTAMVKTELPPLRLKAAEALGRIGRPDVVPALLGSLRKGCDRFLEHALIYALIQINSREGTLPALNDVDPRVRKAGLIALDQMKDGNLQRELVVPMLDSDDADLQHTALGVIGKHPGWSGAIEGTLRKWLASPRRTAALNSSLTDTLLSLSGEANVQELVAESLADPLTTTATRLLLLGVIGRCPQNALPAKWLKAIEQALGHKETAIRREAVGLVKARNLRQFDAQLLELSREAGLPGELRVGALECLAAGTKHLDAGSFALLTAHLSEKTEPLVRLTAARTLAVIPLSTDQLVQLTAVMPEASTLVLRLLLPPFAKTKDGRVGTALVDALQRCPAAEALSLAELDKALKSFTEEVRARARPLRDKLVARQKDQMRYLATLKGELDQLRGNAEAGQQVFLSPKFACYGCHRAAGRGGQVGPDLSRIGKIRSPAELLESIVFPSLAIAPEFRTYQISTRDGRAFTGLIFRDSTEALYLRTAQLEEVRIARKDVEDVTPSPVSLMPDGLEKTMSRQELRDLLEFLVRQQ